MLNVIKKPLILTISLLAFGLWLGSCSGGSSGDGGNSSSSNESSTEQSNKASQAKAMIDNGLGVGPVKEVELGEKVDQAMAKKGEKIYQNKCTSCHKPEKEHIGPAPTGVLDRRKPEWVMNMILNPREMVQKDPTAQELQAEYNSVMSQQVTDRKKARQILEYFRTLEK